MEAKIFFKIELKTDIETSFDESFLHFKLTPGYTPNKSGIFLNWNVKAIISMV